MNNMQKRELKIALALVVILFSYLLYAWYHPKWNIYVKGDNISLKGTDTLSKEQCIKSGTYIKEKLPKSVVECSPLGGNEMSIFIEIIDGQIVTAQPQSPTN